MEQNKSAAAVAVSRAIELIELIAERDDLTSARSVAAAAGLPNSSVARILSTLTDTGMLVTAEGRYQLGPRLRRLGISALDRMDVRVVCRSVLADLAAQTQETVSLNVRFGDVRRYVEQIESPQMLRARAEIGRPYPLLVGAPGRALIYPLADDEIDALLGRAELHRYTAKTPVTRDTVWVAIREARRVDAAVARDEVIPGLATVAVPVRDRDGEVVAALGIAGPTARLDEDQLLALRPVLHKASAELSAALGPMAAELAFGFGSSDTKVAHT